MSKTETNEQKLKVTSKSSKTKQKLKLTSQKLKVTSKTSKTEQKLKLTSETLSKCLKMRQLGKWASRGCSVCGLFSEGQVGKVQVYADKGADGVDGSERAYRPTWVEIEAISGFC